MYIIMKESVVFFFFDFVARVIINNIIHLGKIS